VHRPGRQTRVSRQRRQLPLVTIIFQTRRS
jgi:hypothetical protein